jgi:hypothetical protein
LQKPEFRFGSVSEKLIGLGMKQSFDVRIERPDPVFLVTIQSDSHLDKLLLMCRGSDFDQVHEIFICFSAASWNLASDMLMPAFDFFVVPVCLRQARFHSGNIIRLN